MEKSSKETLWKYVVVVEERTKTLIEFSCNGNNLQPYVSKDCVANYEELCTVSTYFCITCGLSTPLLTYHQ